MHPNNGFIERILLIDDDPDDCILFRQALQEFATGIEVFTTDRIENAIRKVEQCFPNLIFLDIKIPGLDGFDFLRTMRYHPKTARIPVIMYSSSQNPVDVTRSYGLGANLFFRKPSSYTGIVENLRAIFELPWNDPNEITLQFFRNGKYAPFQLNEPGESC
ncbi:MAG TPA: response regulator [Flavisolibacter sp.]